MDWSVFYLSMRHLPKPLSNSCQWQPQVHMSLKHTFLAADVCVVTTRLIWMARAWDLTLSNSDLFREQQTKLKGMSTLKVITWVFSWVKEDPLIPNQLVISGHNPGRFLKELCKLCTFSSNIGTYVTTQTLVIKVWSAWSWNTTTNAQIL